jgi:drug/metabolite transporter (DMT)-like permease
MMRAGIVFGVLSGAAWGFVFLVPALLPQFPPLLLASGRYLLYGLVSLLLAWPWLPRLVRRFERGDLRLLVELALTGNLVYYVLLASAVQMAGVASTSLIIGATPVVITLLGRRDAGAVSMRRLLVPLGMVLAGVACINLDVLLSAHAQARPLGERALGMALAAGAVLSWAWYAARNARFLQSQSRFDGNQWSLLWGIVTGALGGLIWLAVLALPGDAFLPDAGTTSADWTRFWGLNLFLAIACSWFGNWMWNAAARRLPLTLSGQMLVFETLFALLYGFTWAQRWPTPLEIVAVLLLVCGVVLSARRHAQPAAMAPAPH